MEFYPKKSCKQWLVVKWKKFPRRKGWVFKGSSWSNYNKLWDFPVFETFWDNSSSSLRSDPWGFWHRPCFDQPYHVEIRGDHEEQRHVVAWPLDRGLYHGIDLHRVQIVSGDGQPLLKFICPRWTIGNWKVGWPSPLFWKLFWPWHQVAFGWFQRVSTVQMTCPFRLGITPSVHVLGMDGQAVHAVLCWLEVNLNTWDFSP